MIIFCKKRIHFPVVLCLVLTTVLASRLADTSFECQENLFWDGNKCVQCASGCDCSTTLKAGSCDKCASTYFTTTAPPTYNCIKCGGCEECCLDSSQSQICYKCLDGYYLNNGACKYCADPNCKECDANGACQKCKDLFFLDKTIGNQCVKCDNSCASCLTRNSCDKCFDGYYLSVQSSLCALCKDWNCKECDQTKPAFCRICKKSYYPKNGKCVYLRGCSKILIENGTCEECLDGFYLDSDDICQKCVTPQGIWRCSGSDGKTLIQCQQSKVLIIQGDVKACVQIDLKCDALNIQGLCSTCNTAFPFNDNGNCYATCSEAIQGCVSCTTGTSSTALLCQTCASGFTLSSNECIQCDLSIPNCLECSSASVCTKCRGGYFPDASNLCQICTTLPYLPTACASCSSATACEACASNAFGTAPNCIDCHPSCVTCTGSSPTQCSSCKTGFYLATSTSECKLCQESIKFCQACTFSTACTRCAPGKVLSPEKTRCLGVRNCLLQDDGITCMICDQGYILKDGNCVPCLIDNSCNANETCGIVKNVTVVTKRGILLSTQLLFLFGMLTLFNF